MVLEQAVAEFLRVIWDLDDEEKGNVRHIADHGISKDNVIAALTTPIEVDRSRSSGEPIEFGYALDGRKIAVIYEQVDEESAYPITAYEVEE